ncbi:putative glycosyltransferase [Carex littledalei]|uniref:Putative glycosyltransferase n=1 Tax=Carex littledalei TaxID=544730 RepID=A0A833QLN1_9POAL|nr:putative glycosyltransferase [Carex littledalei]
MRPPKVLHRFGGAAAVRQRHIIAALMLTSVMAALLIAFTVPQRALIISSSSSADLDSLTPLPLPNLSDWTSPFFSNDDDLRELEADSTKVNYSPFPVVSSPPVVTILPSPVDNSFVNGEKLPPSFEPSLVSYTAPSPSPSDSFDDLVEESAHIDLKAPPFIPEPGTSDTSIWNLESTQSEAHASDVQLFQPQAPLWPSPADQELVLAKRELEAGPLVSYDPDLYAPLFRNVSTFKRSYELMEKTLKVYIYQEGTRPIFHTPELKGIYASEGWFMKLLEGNKQYTTKDPTRAHLFYLPYSSRRLEYALYVPGSHTILPLSKFVKGYVEMLSAKYFFWNRTRGADHFFVACHDWGPYTTKLHEELRRNAIKALCNADTSEGVFIEGKDVSLPETFIKFPKRPQRDVGGKPVSQRTILAFFAGQMHGRVRPVLVQHWGNNRDPEMQIYASLPKSISKKMSYSQHMKSSKFCICPMGYEVNSPRIVEAIYNGCVPVIIADHFVLPFDEVLNWGEFSVVVLERDIPKLKEILVGISQKRYMDLWMNVNRVQRHFLWHMKPEKYDLFHMVLHSIWFSRLNQIQAH